jgi:hypothetical protein
LYGQLLGPQAVLSLLAVVFLGGSPVAAICCILATAFVGAAIMVPFTAHLIVTASAPSMLRASTYRRYLIRGWVGSLAVATVSVVLAIAVFVVIRVALGP